MMKNSTLARLFLVVIIATLVLSGCGSKPKGITVIGTSPSDSFVDWVEENIPLHSPSGQVRWSGTLVFFDPVDPEGEPEGRVDEAKAYAWDEDVFLITFKQVSISTTLSEDLAKIVIKKEVLGLYATLEWWLDNQEYISIYDTEEFNTFVDGMAAHTVADAILDYGYPVTLIQWDGRATPTCEHLLAIQEMWQEGLIHKDTSTNGNGIRNLILREGCQ